jgi:hypothetical protein
MSQFDINQRMNQFAPSQNPQEAPQAEAPTSMIAPTEPQQSTKQQWMEKFAKDDNAQLMTGIAAAVQQDPDKAGEAQKIAAMANVPASIALRNMEELGRRTRMEEWRQQNLSARFPVLANKMRDADFAAIAQDDRDNLTKSEDFWSAMPLTGNWAIDHYVMPNWVKKQALSGVTRGLTQHDAKALARPIIQTFNSISDDEETTLRKDYDNLEKLRQMFGQATGSVAEPTYALTQFVTSIPAMGTGAVLGGIAGGAVGVLGGPFMETTVPAMIGLGTRLGSAGGMYRDSYESNFAEIYFGLRNKGYSRNESFYIASGSSSVIAAMDVGAFGFVTSASRAAIRKTVMNQFLERMGKRALIAEAVTRPTITRGLYEAGKHLAESALGEAITEPIQDLIPWGAEVALYNLGKTKEEQERLKAPDTVAKQASQFIDTFLQTAQGSWIFGVPAAAHVIANSQHKVAQAKQTQEFIQTISDNALNAKVRDRNQNKFQDWIAEQADGKAGSTIYIDGQAMSNVLQQANIPVEAVDKLVPGLRQQVANLQSVGMDGDVTIETSRFASHLAGTPLGEALMPHVRMSPDAISFADAPVAARVESILNNSVKRQASDLLDAKRSADQSFIESAHKVEDGVKAQLIATGQYSSSDAASSATVVRDFVSVMAARSKKTPEQFFDEHRLQIMGAVSQVEPTPAAEGQFDQAGRQRTETPEFKSWFGESKVVDAEGKPLVVYHGTSAAQDFAEFQVGPSGIYGKGVYLTNTPQAAATYAGEQTGARTIPVYVSLKNPFVYDERNNNGESFLEAVSRETGVRVSAASSNEKVQRVLRDAGFDGVEVRNVSGPEDTRYFVAFDPTQIKSVFNRGTYSPETGNILEQAAIEDAAEDAKGDDVAPTEQPPVPEQVDELAALDNANKLASSRVWDRGRDLKAALQSGLLAEARKAGIDLASPSPETIRYLVRVGVRDAKTALKQNANAVGWYDIKTRQALAVMALVHPEIATDENARFAFVWALAVTSNGLKVDKNFELAEQAYRQYKKKGVMPTDVGIGTAGEAINNSLGLFNELVQEWGIDDLRRFMQTNFTVGEIAAISKDLKPGGEHVATVVRGSAILGPKIGNGFFSNLYGNFSSLTMDRWLIRTWGRWTGTLIKDQPTHTADARARLSKSIASMTPKQLSQLSQIVGIDVATADADQVAVAIQEASANKTKRDSLNLIDATQEFRKSGNGLAKYLDGQKEAPSGPGERTFIRDVFSQILAELQQIPEYADLTMADLQAALWYAEKRLYENAKEDVTEDEIEGYTDEEAPDYANAAVAVAKAKKVSNAKISEALNKEQQRDRAAGIQFGDAESTFESEGKRAAPAGFSESEKRQFVGTVATRRIRIERRSDTTGNWSYRARSDRDGRAVRVLKKLGVKYIAEWKPGKALKRVYGANGVVAPTFVELEPSLDSGRAFQARIQASKSQNKFGAAVYVYSAEEYAGMRLFLSEDGNAGVAVKPDGDMVSVFSTPGSNMGRAVVEMGVAAGATKGDAFETILPAFYAAHGFKVVSRLKWDESQRPADWDKATFGKFNNGEPDVVFMAYDPNSFERHEQGETGAVATSYDNALELQAKEQERIARRMQREGRAAMGAGAPRAAALTPQVFEQAQIQKAQFYSALEQGIAGIDAESLATDGWKQRIQGLVNKGLVKKEELEWSGLLEWLDGHSGDKLTRAQMLEYLEGNGVQVRVLTRERVSKTNYEYFQFEKALANIERDLDEAGNLTPEVKSALDEMRSRANQMRQAYPRWANTSNVQMGSMFEEMLRADNEAVSVLRDTVQAALDKTFVSTGVSQNAYSVATYLYRASFERPEIPELPRYDGYRVDGDAKNYRETLVTIPRYGPATSDQYVGKHWDEENVVVHVRSTERIDANGKRVMFIEEVQSDWGQDIRGTERMSAEQRQELTRQFRQALIDYDNERDNRDKLNVKYGDQKFALLEELRRKNRVSYMIARDESSAKQREILMQYVRDGVLISAPDFVDTVTQMLAARERTTEADNRVLNLQSILDAPNYPDAPFVGSTEAWLTLALKQVVLEAMANGIDTVMFSPDTVHTKRWGSQQILWNLNERGNWSIRIQSQVDGRAAGINLEEEAIRRGLANNTEYEIPNDRNAFIQAIAPELRDETFNNKTSAQAEAMASKLWDRMQANSTGVMRPRREGFEGFYGDANGNNVNTGKPAMLRTTLGKLAKKIGARIETAKIATFADILQAGPTATFQEDLFDMLGERVEFNIDNMRESLQAWVNKVNLWVGEQVLDPNVSEQLLFDAMRIYQEVQPDVGVTIGAGKGSERIVKQIAAMWPTQMPTLGGITLELTPESRAKAEGGFPLFQAMPSPTPAPGPRGTLDPSKLLMTLGKAADRSTFLHESAHYFLTVMGNISGGPSASPEMRSEFDTLLRWFGIAGSNEEERIANWSAMSLDEQREYHEQFAYNFEIYLSEGRAPSPEMETAFEQFAMWLKRIYVSIRDDLNAIYRAQFGRDLPILTGEVRQVMDRMLATDAQIERAEAIRSMRAVFQTREEALAQGMSEEEWLAYQDMDRAATREAKNRLRAESMQTMGWVSGARERVLRELQSQQDDRRREVRDEIRDKVAKSPIYRAIRYLRRGEYEDGDGKIAKADAGYKLSGSGVDEVLNAANRSVSVAGTSELRMADTYIDPLRIPRWATASEGQHPDVVAERFGFSSGHELLRALVNAKPMREEIAAQTDAEMERRYGDIDSPQAREAAVDMAIHNAARSRFVAVELRFLAKIKAPVRVMLAAARSVARAAIAEKRIRDLRPGDYTAAEAKAAREAESAYAARQSPEQAAQAAYTRAMTDLAGSVAAGMPMSEAEAQASQKAEEARQRVAEREAAYRAKYPDGDPAEVIIRAKRTQMVQNQMASQALEALNEIKKGVRYLRDVLSDGNRKRMGAEAADQIEAILSAFDLRPLTQKQMDLKATLRAWLDSLAKDGIVPDIDPDLISRAKPFREMTVSEFREVMDAVKQVEHVGKNARKIMAMQRRAQFETERDGAILSIRTIVKDRVRIEREAKNKKERRIQWMRGFFAEGLKAASVVRIMDGGKDGGPMWQLVMKPANMCADRETTMKARATTSFMDIMAPIFAGGRMEGAGIHFASIDRSMTRAQRIAIALNMGNAGNIQRLLDGENWSMEQIQPILQSLTAEEWRAVQKVWDEINTYKPLIAEKERRLYGKEPRWVEPQPLTVQTADGETLTLAGGYYPAKYDYRATRGGQQISEEEAAKRDLDAARISSTTHRSFVKNRAEEPHVGPLSLSLDVLFSGMNDVIHDLCWHEYLIDLQRLLRDKKFDRAVRESWGQEFMMVLDKFAKAVAAGERIPSTNSDKFLMALRQNTSAAALGYQLLNVASQVTGFANSIVRVGPKWIGRGVGAFMQNPAKAIRMVQHQSEFMRNRARTQFRELNELKNIVRGQSAMERGWKSGVYFLTARMQRIVDVPTWMGAYEKALSEGNTEEDAVLMADQAVIDSQGSGMVKDMSEWQRGTAAQKMFTVFYDYMNTVYNQVATSAMTPQTMGKKAADMVMLLVVPVVLNRMLRDALTPSGGDDDEKYWKKLARRLAEDEMGYLLGTMIYVREFNEALKVISGGKSFGYQGPTGLRQISDLIKLGQQSWQMKLDRAFRKSAIDVLGDYTGIPSVQINRTIDGVEAMIEGKTKNPLAVFAGVRSNK